MTSYAAAPIPILSANAGDPLALANPNSPESLIKLSTEQQTQAGVDTKFDAQMPNEKKKEGFQITREYDVPVEYSEGSERVNQNIPPAIFLTLGILLVLYSVARE